ncbi:MAG TPA: hypothetical protein VIV56_07210 [Gemmatimonadales bacterium]
MLPRRDPTARKLQIARLDDLCRRLTMIRAGAVEVKNGSRMSWLGKCERCPKRTWLQWSHFYSRAIHSTRWDMDNVHAICSGCHFAWAHHRPALFVEWMKVRLGPARYEALALRANPRGRGAPRLDLIELYLRAELRAATRGANAAG